MEFFKNLFSDKKVTNVVNKTTHVVSTEPKTIWRNNMWVMTPNGVGIIFKLGEPCTVHLVNEMDGTTKASIEISTELLRQAKFAEIPECRKCSEEKAQRLGYL